MSRGHARPWFSAVPAVLVGIATAPVRASAATDGFAAGALHLATELDHLLAIVAVSLLAATTGQGRWLFAAFALVGGLATGALFGGFLPPLPVVDVFNQASIAILGALLIAQPRLPPVVLLAIVFLFAWCHGYANTLDRGGLAPPVSYVAGIALAATAVFGAMNALYALARTGYHCLAVRVVGSWICAIGLMVLAFHLTHA